MLKKRCQFDAKFNEVFESGFKIFLRSNVEVEVEVEDRPQEKI